MTKGVPVGICYRCKHYVPLTNRELDVLRFKFIQIGLNSKTIRGACIKPVRDPLLLVRGYLSGNEIACSLFEKGSFAESVYVYCNNGNNVKLTIQRTRANLGAVFNVSCDQSSNCRKGDCGIQLKTRCLFCKQPLTLESGEILGARCPKCHQYTQIPISLKTWPNFAKPEGGCVHFADVQECVRCASSRQRRINLLDLEIDDLKIYLKTQPTLASRKFIKNKGPNEWFTSDDFDVEAYLTNGRHNENLTGTEDLIQQNFDIALDEEVNDDNEYLNQIKELDDGDDW